MKRHYLFSVTAATILSLITCRLIMLLHHPHLKVLSEAAYGITCGRPHWQVYQNRLLGPYSVKYLSEWFSQPFLYTFIALTICLIFMMIYLALFLLFKLTNSWEDALKYTLLMTALFIIVQDRVYLYLWDFFELITGLLLCYGILSRKNVFYFILLFCLAIFNKESALFIGVWLIIDALLTDSQSEKHRYFLRWDKWLRLVTGGLMIAAGIVIVEMIRNTLFIRATGFIQQAGPGDGTGSMVHFKFFRNIYFLAKEMMQPDISLNFIIPLILLTIIPLFLIYHIKYSDGLILKLIILCALHFLVILCFGAIMETRVFIALIPYIVMIKAACEMRSPRSRG